jgi:hypothetical protein
VQALTLRLRGKLTYANVMATVAVFVALGGASYAATELPRNSVGTAQIKEAAVTPAKLSAAARPSGAVFTPALPSSCHEGDQPGWRSRRDDPVGYYRDPFGFVHLEGQAVSCEDGARTMFLLPPGYQPRNLRDFHVRVGEDDNGGETDTITWLRLFPEPGFVHMSGSVRAGEGVELSGISFRCWPPGTDGCP